MYRSITLLLAVAVLAGCGQAEQQAPVAPSAGASAGSSAVDMAADAAGVSEDSPHPGQEIYQNFCFSCHAAGVSGAPKLGDAEAWAPRIAKGPDLLLQATIEGVPPAMPAKGMCFNCTDEQLEAAVDYMVQQAQ